MKELAQRAYFFLCLAGGRALRSGRYTTTRIVSDGGDLRVRKRRLFHAPFLIWMGGPLVRVLNTGVRILPQVEWEDRVRRVSQSLRGTSIQTDAGRTLVLPYLAGETLATSLEDPQLETSVRKSAMELAVIALAEFHDLGLTHGDAIAENVVVDLETGVAHWFDFETVHDSSRGIEWRRADDVRALLASCVLRTAPEDLAETVHLILDVYQDEDVTRLLAENFASGLRRPLTFHLAQAALSFQSFREIGRLLSERLVDSPPMTSFAPSARPSLPME